MLRVPTMSGIARLGKWPLWLILLIVILTVFNGLPFLAPLFMWIGWDAPGRAIYLIYSFLCHQMAQRSFFLFGLGGLQMYNIASLPLDLNGLSDGSRIMALRSFIGNAQIGWKMAWSDRMVYMYGSPLLLTVSYGLARTRIRIRPIPLWLFGLLMLPMAVDGFTHMISDFAGIGQGFRDSNLWLAGLTGNAFPAWFYAGDALGSFNSWMRLFSGLTIGLAVVGLLLPYVDDAGITTASLPRPVLSEDTPQTV